jgi:hypothetical protein
MKMVKSLVLGSTAALFAMSGAQAADLPLKAKAVEYVKICSLYGAGFWYIPGTDTCLKLGGYLRTEIAINTNTDHIGNVSGQGGLNNRYTNAYTWRSREDLSIDTRTATEYGVVRTFSDLTFSWTTDSYQGNGFGGTTYGPIGSGATLTSLPNNAGSGTVAGGTLGMYYAFIQFAGFTMGKAISQFSTPWTNYPGNNFDGLVGGGGTVTGVNQFTYTWDFGAGTSFALSAQDGTAYYQAGVNNLSAASIIGSSNYAGTAYPDFVGMFRIDQAWGLFQASVAAHDSHAAYYTQPFANINATELGGHPDDKWGWAVQLALQIKNIPTGPGDDFKIQGVYTNGATRYNIQDLAGQFGATALYGGSGSPFVYQSVAFAFAPDTVFATGTNQHAISTWGVRGAFNHNWDPHWASSVYGAWAQVRYDDFSKGLICGITGVTGPSAASSILNVPLNGVLGSLIAPGGHCNPDYSIGQLGFTTIWTPVKNLSFSADVTWQQIDQKNSGVTFATPAIGGTTLASVLGGNAAFGKPSGIAYELKNENNWTLLLRAQRNW